MERNFSTLTEILDDVKKIFGKDVLEMKDVKVKHKVKRYPVCDDVVYSMAISISDNPDEIIRREALTYLQQLIHHKLLEVPGEYVNDILVLSNDFTHGDWFQRAVPGAESIILIQGFESQIPDSKISKIVMSAIAKTRYTYGIDIQLKCETTKCKSEEASPNAIICRDIAFVHPDAFLTPVAEVGYIALIKSALISRFQPNATADNVDMSAVERVHGHIVDEINKIYADKGKTYTNKEENMAILVGMAGICINAKSGKPFTPQKVSTLAYFIIANQFMVKADFEIRIVPVVVDDTDKETADE